MGTYMNQLEMVKRDIYNKNISKAYADLKNLLNQINLEYMSKKDINEKNKYKNAILKLLPVLNELKENKVGDNTINVLNLNPSYFASDIVVPPPSTSDIYDEVKEESEENNKEQENEIVPEDNEEKEVEDTNKKEKKIIHVNKNELMPLTFDDYIGQERVKQSLSISINAAKKLGNCLSHLIICSHYGLGKTTLANIIANEMEMPFINVNATNLKDVKSLCLFFTKIDESCIIFIDEIHTLKKDVQTVLLSIMTEFTVNYIDENGDNISCDLPKFTLIGATTQAGELLKPFLNRFSVIELQDYTDEERNLIVESKFKKLGFSCNENARYEIARRSRGIPRTIETYVKGCIDVAVSRNENEVNKEITDLYFSLSDIDELGLTKNDKKILNALYESDKPLALVTLESKCGIQKEDLEYRYEPYLIQLGFIEKMPNGRIITEKGKEYIQK